MACRKRVRIGLDTVISSGDNRSTNPNYALVPASSNPAFIFGPTYSVNQRTPTQFQPPPITSVQFISKNTTSDIPLLGIFTVT